jgi:hypothetical protein
MIEQTPLPLGEAAFFVWRSPLFCRAAMLICFGHDLPPDSAKRRLTILGSFPA